MENNKKKAYLIDVPVLLIFFNRPNCLKKVFDAVKNARPSKLFLYQDGPRIDNSEDKRKVEECRRIVENIDWDCKVQVLYQRDNIGCDPSGYIARKWAFDHADRCIILEDDCVPTQSFFPYCKELLDKYADDQRINMICGMNNLQEWNTPYSYLYSDSGSIWGVATWKRVIDLWEETYGLCGDSYSSSQIKQILKNRSSHKIGLFDYWLRHKNTGIPYHESLGSMCQISQNMLNIIPTKNMIINVGNGGEGGTHSVEGFEMIPHGLRRLFLLKGEEIEIPLKHPPYLIQDLKFAKRLHRLMGDGYPLVRLWRLIEKSLLILRYKGYKALIRKYKSRKL